MLYSTAMFNRALRAVGEAGVSSIDEDIDDETPNRVIKLIEVFPSTYGRTLKAIGRGNFIQHKTLSPISAPGDGLFPYRFAMPADGIAFIMPKGCAGIEAAVEQVGNVWRETIRAKSDAPLDLSYVSAIPADKLDEEVFEAVALALAAAVAWQLTGSIDKADKVKNEAADALRIAKGAFPQSDAGRPMRRSRMGTVRGGATHF